MKKFKNISLPALIVTLAFVFAVAPAIAHGDDSGSDDNGSDSSQSHQSTESGDDSTSNNDGTDDTSDTSGDSGTNETEHHSRSDHSAMAQTHKHMRTEAEREHACSTHKQGLENKFSHIVANSQSLEDRITNVLNKVVAYQQDKNVQVDNFDSLVNTAKSAQSDTDAAITNLKAVTPSLDCNNVSVASDVSTFKTAAKQTRDSLRSYRDAVKNVIKALLGAKQTGSEGSSQ